MIRDRKSSPLGRWPPLQGQIASAADLYFMGSMGIARRFFAIFRNRAYATYGGFLMSRENTRCRFHGVAKFTDGDFSMCGALNIIAGCCGIIGGVLWFLAAGRMPTPPIGSYWDVADSPTSQFAKVWRKATWLNQSAAAMTGISALLFGISAFFKS